MKRLWGMVLAAAMGFAAPVTADPLEGLWQTPADAKGRYAQMQIGECEDQPGLMCGVITGVFDAKGELPDAIDRGRTVMQGMQPVDTGIYTNGYVIAPNTQNRLQGNATLVGDDLLRVEGCIPMMCKTEELSRVR
ncbi:MAG: DUF2147 domain-containing protein [Pseudomonadota bacterium]